MNPMPKPRVHRPVVCEQCHCEMQSHTPLGWFRCLLCGSERKIG